MRPRLTNANFCINQAIYAHRLRGTDSLAADAIGRLFGEPQSGDSSIHG